MGLLQGINPLCKFEHHPEGSVAKQVCYYSAQMHSLICEVCPGITAISKVSLCFMLITTYSLVIINHCSVVISS